MAGPEGVRLWESRLHPVITIFSSALALRREQTSRFCRAVSIVAFFNKIIACQELFCLVTLLASSIKHAGDFGGNEKINTKSNRLNTRNKNSERAAHYLAAFFVAIAQVTVSNLIVATSIPVGEVNTFTESL